MVFLVWKQLKIVKKFFRIGASLVSVSSARKVMMMNEPQFNLKFKNWSENLKTCSQKLLKNAEKWLILTSNCTSSEKWWRLHPHACIEFCKMVMKLVVMDIGYAGSLKMVKTRKNSKKIATILQKLLKPLEKSDRWKKLQRFERDMRDVYFSVCC